MASFLPSHFYSSYNFWALLIIVEHDGVDEREEGRTRESGEGGCGSSNSVMWYIAATRGCDT